MNPVLKIMIDDTRDDNYRYNLPKMDLIIRDNKALDFIKPRLKCVDIVLFLDHDLGMTEDARLEKDGYHILMDLFRDGIYPIMVRVITSNPVGRKNIESALRSEGYETNGIGEWSR